MAKKRPSVERTWKEFWAPILMKNGVLNMKQLKKELYDFTFVIDEVPKVYCAITGNRLSKVMYDADTVIEAYEAELNRQVEEAVTEAEEPLKDEISDIEAERDSLQAELDQLRDQDDSDDEDPDEDDEPEDDEE